MNGGANQVGTFLARLSEGYPPAAQVKERSTDPHQGGNMRSFALLMAAIGATVSLGSTAHATGIAPLPEPGILSIVGAALAGVIIGGRFINRK